MDTLLSGEDKMKKGHKILFYLNIYFFIKIAIIKLGF